MTPPTYSSAAKMAKAQARFFAAKKFAVVGASQDPSKFGHRIFKWYLDRNLTAVPVNPSVPNVLNIPTVSNLQSLTSPADYSVSVITPPNVTRGVIEAAAELGIKNVWLQPGAESADVISKAQDLGLNLIAGGGACVLVSGEEALRAAARL
ncbi:hypothetical protein HDU86_006014 [Geranomyces michiganensis]|nr:hypothetical protein HDU86_006014 [Geranomyces michiganensis]